MHGSDTLQSRTIGAGLVVSGLMLAAAAAAAAWAAADHMAAAFCGPVLRHCLLCAVSAASLVASFGVLAAGVLLLGERPSLQRAGRGARPSA